jgi:hypothetical protein
MLLADREAQAFFLAADGDHVAFAFVGKKMVQPHAEDHGDAQQCWQRGKEFAALQL